MKKISVYRPTSIEEAIQILSLHGTDAGVYAGGTDLLIRLKNRLKQAPTYLVDIKKIGNLRYIKETPQGGVQIGTLTKLAEIAESDLLAKKYATVKIAGPSGIKEMSVEQLVPGDMMVDGRIQSHVVRFNEILTEVVIPLPKPGFRASFEKLRPRGVWDFAMASTALGLQLRDRTIEDARVVFGGIAGKPYRERVVEAFLKGKTLSADLATPAVSSALANAAPLKYNATKIDMAKGLLASGLDKLAAS